MELEALEFTQQKKQFYFVVFSVKDLAERLGLKTDVWTVDNPRGYQRRPLDFRIKAFSSFVGQGGVSPLSVVLSSRNKLIFNKKYGNYGSLKLPDNADLWQVDGQHRLEGLKRLHEETDEFDNFMIPVILFSSLDWAGSANTDYPRYLEAGLFYTINKTQKGVKADLVERYLLEMVKQEGMEAVLSLPSSMTRNIEWVTQAIQIADKLNNNESVWKGRIRMPNENKRGRGTISQKSFTDSLQPIITSEKFRRYTEDELTIILTRYWDALRELMPDAFQDPKNYVIQKITGPFVLHRMFPTVAEYVPLVCKNNTLTKENFKTVLADLKDGAQSKFWATEGAAGTRGTNRKAFSYLTNLLKLKLNKSRGEVGSLEKPYKL